MAAGFDIRRYFTAQSAEASPRICERCHRMIIACSCSNTAEAVTQTGFYSDDIFDVDFLDIENAEAQPESDLDVAAPLCDKSHQHRDFIDVDDFTIDHLPSAIRHYTTYVWLRNCVPFVVRLLRNITATGRACLHSEDVGKTVICDDVHCPYVTSLGPDHTLHGGIGIITNKHVVKDDDQAAMTKVEFFYNNDDSRREIVVKELGTKLYLTNTKMDYTLFTCYVHSKDLIALVEKFDKRRNYSWLAIPEHIRERTRNFAIVISHPHGTSKKISIGNVIERRTQARSRQEIEIGQILRSIYDLCDRSGGLGMTRFGGYLPQVSDINLPHLVTWYTAPTCKGSSGAPVYMGNTVVQYVDFLDIENAESQPGSDLDVAAPLCDKSHQHPDFIDVDDVTIDHLPSAIRHYTTYVWLRNCVPFVVRLLRNITATGRACLHSEDVGKTVICDDVHCPYVMSLGPDHTLHGGIGIITNKHVVKDDDQAAMTKVEFFYNNDDSRREIVVKELGTKLYMTNTKMDYTLFTCYVHSKDLIALVEKFDKRRNYSWLAIPEHIREHTRNFAIVISHPHGASKKISIGNVIERRTQARSRQEIEIGQILRSIYDLCDRSGDLGMTRFGGYWRQVSDINLPHSVTWYTAPTCKGSSGAPVYMGNTVVQYGEEINQAHTHRGMDSKRGFNNCFT